MLKVLILAVVLWGVVQAQAAQPQNTQAQKAIEATFQKTCAVCHNKGVAGAPIVGDRQAWETRKRDGIESLLQSVIQGKGTMPPRGMCGNCSVEELRQLVELMSQG